MDDNARALHHERIDILSAAVRRLRAEVARLQTERDGLRTALDQAVGSALAERAKRIRGEAVILAARRVMSEPSRDNLKALAAAIKDHDKAMEGRA